MPITPWHPGRRRSRGLMGRKRQFGAKMLSNNIRELALCILCHCAGELLVRSCSSETQGLLGRKQVTLSAAGGWTGRERNVFMFLDLCSSTLLETLVWFIYWADGQSGSSSNAFGRSKWLHAASKPMFATEFLLIDGNYWNTGITILPEIFPSARNWDDLWWPHVSLFLPLKGFH